VPPAGWVIETNALTRTFGRVRAVDDLRLTVLWGGIFGFPGPSGAGRATTIQLLPSAHLGDG
jgi:ABC-type multidrug transport system ATPase subunit